MACPFLPVSRRRVSPARLALLVFTLASVRFVAAESVSEAPWYAKPVASGVTWKFHQFESLYGLRQSVTVIEADLSNPDVQVVVPYLASSRAVTSSFVPAQYPDARGAVNGTFFDTSAGGGGSTTYLRVGGSTITPQNGSSWSTEGGLAISPDNIVRMRRRPSSGWDSNTTDRDIIANGPVVVFDNVIPSFDTIGSHCSARHPRTAMGTTPANKLLLVTVDGRTDGSAGMTCTELGQLMKDLGCDDAVSYDGGGSTTAWVAGQPTSGVVNYPSDNGVYNHRGERSCSNAVAVVAPALPAAPYDAHLLGTAYAQIMTPGQQQSVSVQYKNVGTQTWTAGSVSLVVTRPAGRVSAFEAGSGWPAPGVPAILATSVAPGETATFTFTVTAPPGNGPIVFYEHFGLQHDTAGTFGPPENEPRLKILFPPEDITLDNTNAWVYGSNWSTGTSAADRYGPDYRFKSQGTGSEYLRYRPAIPGTGSYSVYEWHSQGSNRSAYAPHNVLHAGGTSSFSVDQRTNGGRWNFLGSFDFTEGNAGDVRITDGFPDSGAVVIADAVKFRYAANGPPSAPVDLKLDNTAAVYSGSWTASTSGSDRWRENYQWAYSGAAATAQWNANLPLAGNYSVQVWYSQGSNRSPDAPYTVEFDGGSMTYLVNQTQGGGQWVTLGSHYFAIGGGKITLSAASAAPTVVVADAVRFVWESATVPTVLTLESVAAEDGYILESGENSDVGGSINSGGSTLRIGDNLSRQQYRSIVSFKTGAIPDTATIQSATLLVTQGGNTGGPWSTLGELNVDIKAGAFAGNAALETGDFQAAPSAAKVAVVPKPGGNGVQVKAPVNSNGLPYVNKTGPTQLRLSFTLDDDNDGRSDFFSPYSANDSTASRRPKLEIRYLP